MTETKASHCTHQFQQEPHCVEAFCNEYYCQECGSEWQDFWSCACDSECPRCHRDVSPHTYTAVGPCACKYLEITHRSLTP